MRAWGRSNRRLDAGALPVEAGLPARLLVRGPMPVDGDVAAARQLSYRDDPDPAREAVERAEVALFGWGSWLDAGTADAVLKRFLKYCQVQPGRATRWRLEAW